MNSDRLTRILAVITVIGVLGFAGMAVYNKIGGGYKTVTAYVQEVPEAVEADMFIIRDETVLDGNKEGVVVPLAVNGERVSNGSRIAAVFGDEKSAEKYSGMLALEKKLAVYEKINSQVKLANLDIDKLSSEIYSEFYSILDAAYSNDFSDLSSNELSFAEKLSRKNISLGYKIDCADQIAALEKEISVMSSAKPKSIVSAEKSGYYVSRPDGYENILTPEDIAELTEEKLNAAFKSEKSEVANDTFGKIIENFDWYVASVVGSGRLNDMRPGAKADLVLGDSDGETVRAELFKKTVIDDNKVLLVFRCSQMNENLATVRKVAGKIVTVTHNGIKIRRDAIRFDDDGRIGVYIREGNVVKFNRIQELYSNDSYVVAKDMTGTPGWLSQFDKILVSGKELSNGKVID